MNKEKLLILINKYLAGDVTDEELDLLKRYYNSFQDNTTWDEAQLGPRSEVEAKMLHRIQDEIGKVESKQDLNVPKLQKGNIRFLKPGLRLSSFTRIAVAAGVIGLLITSAYLYLNSKNTKAPEVAKAKYQQLKNDVPPGGNRATLTLADGSIIDLADAQNGALAEQGNSRVIKIGGKLAYNTSSENEVEIVYNIVSTPKGGQIKLNYLMALRYG